ncbi:MAG: PilZ domain-containing protein [Sphingomonadales bacterium]|nr:PilZ domain-containing protein [Sphingomonadales bacterium]
MQQHPTPVSSIGPAHSRSAATGQVLDMRGEKRASLLIRSAKLVCQSGEYPCVVRDVSSGGCKLRHFEALPPETYVLLELANGETYAMQRVWKRELESGYQFIRPIDVDAFIEEAGDHPRRPIRLRIRHSATVWAEGKPVDAALVNLSQGGAGIEAAAELPLRKAVRLSIPGLPDQFARICWRRGLAHGMVFDRSLGMAELARHAIELQPFLPASALDQMPLLFEEHTPPRRRATA